jgi:hypothetical protein
MIKIKTVGQFLNGEYKEWYVLIQPTLETKTGAFLILIASTSKALFEPDEKSIGYDYWVENEEALEGFMRETGWEIQWLKE